MPAAASPPHRPSRSRRAVLLGLLLAELTGCGLWRPTVVPMRQLAFPLPCPGTREAPPPLLVMLPGRFMRPQELVDQGFVATVRELGIEADVLLVDAHVGYYSGHSVVERLHADVIEPARRRGVPQIWLAGISLGAFGALLYSESHPGAVTGVVVLGPYLGEPPIAEQIRDAGGLHGWQPPPVADQPVHYADDHRLWRWLKAQTGQPAPPDPTALFLGYGAADRYRLPQRLLAQALPPAQSLTVPGEHDWPAWRPAWRRLLERLPLPRQAACATASGP